MFEAPKLELAKPSTLATNREKLLWERELLGLYLSQHPLDMYRAFLTEKTVPLSEILPEHHGQDRKCRGHDYGRS
jgi:DNA polymerase III alpha subunit